jgi:hypothetical protein
MSVSDCLVRVALLTTIASLGCLKTTVESGVLTCAPDPQRPCPSGYYCAHDACWKNGTSPPLADMGGSASCVPGTECSLASCSNGISTPAAICDETGNCPMATQETCPVPQNGTAVCSGATCDISCNAPDFVKDGAVCSPVWVLQDGNTAASLRAVWGTGAKNVFAVGTGGVIVHSLGDGTWSLPQAGPNPLWTITGIAGTSATDIYIVASDGYTCRSDGTASNPPWTCAAAGSTGHNYYLSIVGTGDPNTYFLTAQGYITIHDGGSSSSIYSEYALPGSINGGWGTYSEFFAVSNMGIYHSTGGGYGFGLPPTTQASAGTRAFSAVWASGSTDVYAVGDGGVIMHNVGGDNWQLQVIDSKANLQGVWGSSKTDIYAVGDSATILHSGGDGKWTKMTNLPALTTARTNFRAVWGSGASDVYVVGDGGVILHLK